MEVLIIFLNIQMPFANLDVHDAIYWKISFYDTEGCSRLSMILIVSHLCHFVKMFFLLKSIVCVFILNIGSRIDVSCC